MKIRLPLALTAASIAVLMGANAQAAQIGVDMNYTNNGTMEVYGLPGTITSWGQATFDDTAGVVTLTIANHTKTVIPGMGAAGTIIAETTYFGTLVGGTWTANGDTSGVISACGGAASAAICGPVGEAIGVVTAGTGGTVFSVDVPSGVGAWADTQINGPAILNNNHALAAVPVPAAAWLFGSALLGLAGVARKRK
jgi:hypothetical protein